MIERGTLPVVATPTADVIADLALAMTRIPSPTGAERDLADWLVQRLTSAGLEVELQVFDGGRANVVARLRGAGAGPTLLLLSPIDTAFPLPGDRETGSLGASASPTIDGPVARDGDWIVGPGAENPKAFAACIVGAAEAIAASGVPLEGDLVVALVAGGMPSLGRADAPGSDGLGRGTRELLARIDRPDFAVVAKPGDAVSWAEAGIALFGIRVSGDLGYTGTRHKAGGRNALRDAALLVERLEAWFPAYAAAHADSIVEPQGAVTSIRSGWPDRPAFMTASCELTVDLRMAPGDALDEVEHELQQAIEAAARDLESDLRVVRLGGFAGGATEPGSWIIRSLVRAWEARTGRPHAPATRTSGVTDASVVRGHGIPTGRIGMPRPESPYPGFSMGVVNVDAMLALTRTLIDVAIDTCGRTRAEIDAAESSGAA